MRPAGLCITALLALTFALTGCTPQAPPAPAVPDATLDVGPGTAATPDAGATTTPSTPQATPSPPVAEPQRLRLDAPRSQEELPTTSCDLFLRNAQSNMEARKKALEQQPDSPFHHANYAGSLLSLGQSHGNLDLVAEAEKIATDGLAKAPNDVGLLELRADARSTRHRFDGALADLELARKLAPAARHADLDLAIANVHFQLGRYDTSIPVILRAVADRPSFGTQSRAAIVYQQTGDLVQARRHFAKAEMMVKDTSPIPLAWLNVQRGLLAMHTGQYEVAHAFFEEAWRRCPRYPMAKEHLAEIEGRLGHLDRSIELYREVVSETSNPEFIAALGEAWEAKEEPGKAAEMFRFAQNKNEQLLELHPEAMYWHASEFYLGPGKHPEKALALLTLNARLRPNADAFLALANAQLALGKNDEARVNVEKALATPIKRPELDWTAARVYKALGDTTRSGEHEARALAVNPKIADLEGEL